MKRYAYYPYLIYRFLCALLIYPALVLDEASTTKNRHARALAILLLFLSFLFFAIPLLFVARLDVPYLIGMCIVGFFYFLFGVVAYIWYYLAFRKRLY